MHPRYKNDGRHSAQSCRHSSAALEPDRGTAVLQRKRQHAPDDRNGDSEKIRRPDIWCGTGNRKQRRRAHRAARPIGEERQKQQHGRGAVQKAKGQTAQARLPLAAFILGNGQQRVAGEQLIDRDGKIF